MILTTVSDYSESHAFVFFDGMNLFNNAKRAFGYSYPNCDIVKLARVVCSPVGCELVETRFYSGVPTINDWRYHFWFGKTEAMRQAGVTVYTRRVRTTPGGLPQEKSIDLRLGLDALALACERAWFFSAPIKTSPNLVDGSGAVVISKVATYRWSAPSHRQR